MTTPKPRRRLLTLIRFIGPWTSLCLAFFIAVVAVAYSSAGSIDYFKNQALVDQAVNQSLLTEQIAKNAIAIELAVQTQDWDIIEPSLLRIKDDYNAWKAGHQSLLNNQANTFHADGDQDSIAQHLSKLTYPLNQINQSITELELVTKSVVRRAPYIEPKSVERITAAVDSYQAQESNFKAAYAQITDLYKLQAAESSAHSIATIHNMLLLSLATVTLAFATGVAPRLYRLKTQIAAHDQEIGRAKKALEDLSPRPHQHPESDSDSQTPFKNAA